MLKYDWSFQETKFTKDKGKVFSFFAGGGGSTMGYKLAGFDVIGCNEIDNKMMKCYRKNHNPKFSYLESIRDFKERTDLPTELYNLDILDGSPPCSSFSISGNREKDWGKEKKFDEGQKKQVLDTLFFDFIDVAKKLQPKVVVAENVQGILIGNAKKYVVKIYEDFDNAGYILQHFLLDGAKMGLPQRRKRVFFIALRKDLAAPFLVQKDLFDSKPNLLLDFSEEEIPYSEIEDKTDTTPKLHPCIATLYDKVKQGSNFQKAHPKGSFFNHVKLHKDRPVNTIASEIWLTHYEVARYLNDKEIILASSFPKDYDFLNVKVDYICGMSVPPLMVAKIAAEIYKQWLRKLN